MLGSSPITSGDAGCHVLHLTSTFAIKTDTKWLIQIARHLDRNAFQLSAACFYGGDGPVRQQLEDIGVRTFDLEVPGERDPRAVLRARKLIDELSPDIVHTHLLRADLFGGAAARWAGVPTILSTVYAVGDYRRARKRKSDRLLDLACSYLPMHTIAVSHAVKRDLIERVGMDEPSISVIHTGIDPPPTVERERVESLRREWNIPPDAVLVVTLARLSYEKGIDVLIDAAGGVREAQENVRFVVVGDGPDCDALSKRIRDRGLTNIVKLAGFAADVWPALAAADVVCIPSKSEGMPNALLEAMAAGRAIVATRVGGIPEALTHGENGLLVNADDAAELAEALLEAVRSSSLRERLGAAARSTALNRFNARRVVDRYAALYQKLFDERKDARAELLAVH